MSFGDAHQETSLVREALSRYATFVDLSHKSDGVPFEAAMAAQAHELDHIGQLPAETVENVLAKARVLLALRAEDGDADASEACVVAEFSILGSIVEDLTRLAGKIESAKQIPRAG